MRSCISAVLIGALAASPTALAQDKPLQGWSTYRGNPARTGCSDNLAGPAAPKVLWVFKSQEHFIATPSPAGDRLFVSGLGAFNVSTFACLSTDPKADKRVIWSKTTPALKLPTVSSPAVVDGLVLFGDGMHQTDGAILHCLRAEAGKPFWKLPVPGTLVHLEGSPAVAGNLAYIGGGALGVICVDITKVSLDGKPMQPAQAQKIIDDKWADLLKKYEEEKKKDPDFAVPPNEDQLPKLAPALVWKQGDKKWHVDAPVNVVGDRVFIASAFLDKEKEGDRAVYCLDAKTGQTKWRAALNVNPWGGPSVLENVVVTTGSTIPFAPAMLKGAKGEIAAFELADGKERWRKEVPGGILGSVALAGGQAICTASDGKVRAFDLASGERTWIYDAKTPFFGPAAVVGGVVYAGDLNGVVHAVNLQDGTSKWRLDLGADPAVKAPGMIYGGPVVHGGKIYVATCNIEGEHARNPTVVVCIGQ